MRNPARNALIASSLIASAGPIGPGAVLAVFAAALAFATFHLTLRT